MFFKREVLLTWDLNEYHVYVAGKDYDRAMRILQGKN